MAMLEILQVYKFFGGLAANADVSFSMEQGMIMGLIGPNGAGKTTLFNCITGYYPPTRGAVRFAGYDVSGKPPYPLAPRGIARASQPVKPFSRLPVGFSPRARASYPASNPAMTIGRLQPSIRTW